LITMGRLRLSDVDFHQSSICAVADCNRRSQRDFSFPMRRRDETAACGVWEFWLYGFRIRPFRLSGSSAL
jgi:hypothetical protein